VSQLLTIFPRSDFEPRRLRSTKRSGPPKDLIAGRSLFPCFSAIDLCLSAFDWAKFRRTKGAIKLHLLLDRDGCLPCYGVITGGKTYEIRVARTLEWPPGSIVVMIAATWTMVSSTA
jgi:hypothetical protein